MAHQANQRSADSKTVTFSSTKPPSAKSSSSSSWWCCGGSGDTIDYETDPGRRPRVQQAQEGKRRSTTQQPARAPEMKAAAEAQGKGRYPGRWLWSAATPPAKLPFRTWADYAALYQAGKIDVADPPLPPGGAEIDALSRSRAHPDPPSAQFYPAPKPLDERERLRQVYALDLLGRYGPPPNRGRSAPLRPSISVSDEECHSRAISEAELQPTSSEGFASATLEGHLKFRQVVAYARQAFNASAAMLTIVEDDQVVCLCESGSGVQDLPREWAVDAHTILGQPRGLVVRDLDRDWRFANSPLRARLPFRFYAGLPVFAPLLDADEGLHALGALSVVDTQPRDGGLSSADRRKLERLVELVRREIHTWHQLRLAARVALLDESLARFQQRLQPPREAPMRQVADGLGGGASTRFGGSRNVLGDPKAEARGLELEHDDSPESRRAKVFVLSMQTISEALELPVVYLLRLFINPKTRAVVSLTQVASIGLPERPAPFDPTLHLRALTSPEGGFLHSASDEAEVVNEKEGGDGQDWAAGLLVSVCSLESKGFVLAAYASTSRRVLGAEDLDYLRHVGNALAPFCREV